MCQLSESCQNQILSESVMKKLLTEKAARVRFAHYCSDVGLALIHAIQPLLSDRQVLQACSYTPGHMVLSHDSGRMPHIMKEFANLGQGLNICKGGNAAASKVACPSCS